MHEDVLRIQILGSPMLTFQTFPIVYPDQSAAKVHVAEKQLNAIALKLDEDGTRDGRTTLERSGKIDCNCFLWGVMCWGKNQQNEL